MDLNEYVQRAKQTESIIPAVKVDEPRFEFVLRAMIASGQLLDMIKKNAFYREYKDGQEIIKKPIDEANWHALCAVLLDAAECLNRPGYAPLKPEQVSLGINPRIFHSIVGIATEATELLEALEMVYVGMHDDFDYVNLQEELGDLAWYQAIAVDTTAADWTKILETNITKLESRNKGKKFNADATVNRDVGAERKILEGTPTCDARALADYYSVGGSDY